MKTFSVMISMVAFMMVGDVAAKRLADPTDVVQVTCVSGWLAA